MKGAAKCVICDDKRCYVIHQVPNGNPVSMQAAMKFRNFYSAKAGCALPISQVGKVRYVGVDWFGLRKPLLVTSSFLFIKTTPRLDKIVSALPSF